MTDDFFIDNPLRLSCADAVELVTTHLDGALEPGDAERLQAHLAGCEACAVYVDQIQLTVRLVSETREDTIDVPAADLEALVAAYERRRPPSV